MLTALEDYSMEIITKIAKYMYGNGEIRSQMYKSTVITIPKIPGTLECHKNRLISITNQIQKLY